MFQKIVLSVAGQEVKCSKKAVGVFEKSLSSLSYCLCLRQERLPELYKLQYNKENKYPVAVQTVTNLKIIPKFQIEANSE